MTPPADGGVDPSDGPVDTPPVDLPPDPSTVAPPLDRSVATSLRDAASFLYTGDDPIQTGVDPATIDIRRVAVLRGRVTGREGAPVTGATVTVLGHPEFGQTLTRLDGAYDLVTNGGGALSITVGKDGFLPAQRTIDVPWQDYVPVPEIVLVQPDPAAPPIDLDGPGMKVARGPSVSDSAGTRRATLLIPPGTQASVTSNAATETLSTLTLHLTEFTTGPRGPLAMPGSLPPTSAYTYAVEVSVDEAGGRSVQLSQPALLYVENFLGFAVGTGMPVGAYDHGAAQWSGLPNGLVLRIVAITGGAADIDSDGDGAADGAATLAALGVTDLERQTLATLYAAGQVLWRSAVPHFSTFDCNRPLRLPGDARYPGLRDPRGAGGVDDGCNTGGSIIQCHNQSLGEDIAINGTSYFLHYQSDRQSGRLSEYSTDIALSDDKIPPSATGIVLEVNIAGRLIRQSFPPTPDQHFVFTWDGKDAYGRLVQGRATAHIAVGYVYQPSYADPIVTGNQFAQFPGGSIDREASPIPTRETVTIYQRWKTLLGPFDALPQGLGGFTISVQHTYDLVGKIFHAGNGETRRAATLGQTALQRVITSGVIGPRFDQLPLSLRPNGGHYIVNAQLKVVFDETGAIVAGTLDGNTFPCSTAGDGGPATMAPLCSPTSVTVGPDGSFYILQNDARIRRVTPDGIIRTLGGKPRTGPIFSCVLSGIGGPVSEAQLCDPQQLTIARDGAVYFQDVTPQILKIGVDGYLSIVAGSGVAGFSGDGGPAGEAKLSSQLRLAIDRDGNLVIGDVGNNRIRRITTDGVIKTIAGTGASGDTGDGGPAISATFQNLTALATAADGSIYVADAGSQRLRAVSAEGVISALAGGAPSSGGGVPRPPTDGAPPTDATFFNVVFVAAGADGAVYVGETRAPPAHVYRIGPALPAYSVTEHVIASPSGGEVYVFDSDGRHLRTLDASSGAIRRRFTYDAAGQLVTITDLDGKVTTIERNPAGDPTAIVAPFGQRTTLTLGRDHYLSKVTDPAGGSHAFSFGASGLLSTYTDPLGGVHRLTYDAEGRLTADQDPSGATKTLSRTGDETDSTVTLTSALGRATRYRIQRLATGDEIWTNTRPDGTQVQVQRKPDGAVTSTLPDGTVTTQTLAPDPRFGMLAPVPASLTLRTPGGLVQTQATSRTATLRNPADLTSLVSATETFTLNGKAFTRTYDAASKTVTVRSPLGRRTTATLDALGRVVSITGTSATALQLAFDGSGRPTAIAHGARQRMLTYDGDGRVATLSDALARTVRYDRDPLGRTLRTHWPDSTSDDAELDALGNFTSVTPRGQASHGFEHDIVGRLSAYVAPDAGANTRRTTYDYNVEHQLTAITTPDGAALTVSYDAAGRPSRVTLPDGTIVVRYDAAGRLSALDAPGGVGVALGYDGGLPTDLTWSGPVRGTLHVAFDNNFHVASESVNGGPAVTASYDDDGLATRVGALAIARDASTGRVTQTSAGSVTEVYTLNALGELATATATCGSTALRTAGLTRDAAGTITGTSETVLGRVGSATYDHDTMGRLTAVHDGARTATYTYDGNGNRLSSARPALVSAVYDAQDRLVQHGSATYAYTARGQLRTRIDAAGTTSYHYDLLGNLRTVDLAGGPRVGYVIDGAGRRIGKTVDGVLVQGWLYSTGLNVAAELDGNSAVVSRFFYATRRHVPDLMIKGGVTYRIISDHVGSPRLVVDVATCQVVQQIDYDEFGRVLADSNPGFQPFGFAGGLHDRDTGLIRFGARDYDPEIGRWTAKDPLGFQGGDSNLYVYAGNNPVNFIDPSGLGFWQGLTDFSAGFGDTMTFGLTRWVRKKLGVDDVVNPCSGWYAAGGVGAIAVVTIASMGTGAVVEEGAVAARGAGRLGGIFSRSTNAAGGEVWTSVGTIAQQDFLTMVNSGMMRGEQVSVLTGVHGLADGAVITDAAMFNYDVATFGQYAGVNVLNVAEMSPAAIAEVVNGPGVIIGGFCNSGACLAPLIK